MENRTLDYKKHVNVFNPVEWNNAELPIHIIGVGATGSWLALSLAKLGIKNLHIYDYDVVEEHNIPNQCFRLKDIGFYKVDALKEIIEENTGIEVVAHNKKVDKNDEFNGIIFILTDTMKSRKELYVSIRNSNNMAYVFETRMDLRCGRVYSFDPNSSELIRWKATLYDDASSEVSMCGVSQTVIPTCFGIINQVIWAFLNHINGNKPPFEIMSDYENFWNVVNK